MTWQMLEVVTVQNSPAVHRRLSVCVYQSQPEIVKTPKNDEIVQMSN